MTVRHASSLPSSPTSGMMASTEAGLGAAMLPRMREGFTDLTDMLALHPPVKARLAAGFTHARVAKELQIRKQKVGEIASTPFRPLSPAVLAGVDPWVIGTYMWHGEAALVEAISYVLDWDATHFADTSPVAENAAQYGAVSVEMELEGFRGAYARLNHGGASEEDKRFLPIAELRVRMAGGSEDDLYQAMCEVEELLSEPMVPEVPDWLLDRTRRTYGEPPRPGIRELVAQREARELHESTHYGKLRPTLPDDSVDERVLARDLLLHNLGDSRVGLDVLVGADATESRRARRLEEFAAQLGVSWDSEQTFAPRSREPGEVKAEIDAALERYLESRVSPWEKLRRAGNLT